MAATPQQRQEFGRLLRSLRESKGLSQRRLAQAVTDLGAEVTDRSVSGWERGAFAPDRRFLVLLEEALGAEGALLTVLGLDERGDGQDRLSLIEARLAAIEEHLGMDGAMATITELPAHEDPALAAAAKGDQSKRGRGPTPGRTSRPKPTR